MANHLAVHGPRYRKLAPLVRRAAQSNPDARCWHCGLTLTEARAKWGPRIGWTAGHLNDDQPDWTLTIADLAPELSRCNYSRGASHGNRNRIEPTSQAWR